MPTPARSTTAAGRSDAAAAVPLRLRSSWSLLTGPTPPAAYLDRAAEWGLPALALTDRDALYGAVPFYVAARERGIRPILGAEITEPDGDAERDGGARDAAVRGAPRGDPPRRTTGSTVAIALDIEGYRNLCRIVTRRRLGAWPPGAPAPGASAPQPASCPSADPGFFLPRAAADAHAGLFFLSESPALLEALAGAGVPRDRLGVEIVRPGRPRRDESARLDAARRAGLAVVASTDVFFADAADHAVHRILVAARENATVATLPPGATASPERRLRSPAEVAALFADIPEALDGVRDVVDRARLTLPLGKPILPKTPLPSGETAFSHLFRLASEGIARRYPGGPTREVVSRLARELDVVARLGLLDYFLIVAAICRFARDEKIPMVGRGSGASSLIAYLLGVTSVDPFRYDLYFERFLHEERADLPDLDIDLSWRDRDRVIAHVYRTYGADKVAMISTHVVFQPRSAFREAARALGTPPADVDAMSRLVPRDAPDGIGRALLDSPRARARGLDPREPRVAAIAGAADRLLGLPRHLGIHPGGLVIADGPLDRYVPLEEAAKGIVVTQYEMRAIEKIGLVKMDLLGNRALSVLAEAREWVARVGVAPGLDAVADDDPDAAGILREARTLGCFQIESPGMRQLLLELGTSDLRGTIDALSLIRPGAAASGAKERFVRRARGLEPTAYLHPRLEPLLRASHGVLVYEEDVMAVAAAIAGLSLRDGDNLRKAIGSTRDDGERRALANGFVRSAVLAGVEPDAARAVWDALAQFAQYAFCRAHAAGYGVIAHRMAWMKARWPAAFAAAFLNNGAGMYPKWVHVEDAKRMGVAILPPCVNRSAAEWTVECDEESARDDTGRPGAGVRGRARGRGAIRVGLGEVRGLAARTIERALAARRERPFAGIGDFRRRSSAPLREAEALLLAGAFAFTGRTRPALLWELHARAATAAPSGADARAELPLVAAHDDPPGPPLPELSRLDVLRHEAEILGLTVAGHPLELFPEATAAAGGTPRRADPRRARVVGAVGAVGAAGVVGVVAASRRTPTRSGEEMLFLTLDDGADLVECVLFPAIYRRAVGILGSFGPYLAEGTIDAPLGAATLRVERLTLLAPDAPRPEARARARAAAAVLPAFAGDADALAARDEGADSEI